MTTPYPYPQPARLPLHPRATASMVLGICAVAGFFLLAPLVVAPLAWYYGAVAQREAEREPTRYRESSEAKAGVVLGMAGTAMLGLVMLLLVVLGTLIVVGSRYDAGYGT